MFLETRCFSNDVVHFAKDFDDNYVEMRHGVIVLEPSMVYQTGDDYSWFVFENKK